MNPTLVNGHVLFWFSADRKVQPDWSRTWHSEIAPAVTAAETRRGLRARPPVKLAWLITPATLTEQIALHECVMAAKKSGLAAAPYHGRSSQLQAEAAASTSVVVNNNFAWAVGDWIFLRHANGTIETRQLTAVNLVDGEWTLDFAAALDETHAASALIWPLLFGEFAAEEMEARSPKTGPLRVSITELISARSAQLGAVAPPAGTGIGVWKIEDTFIVQ
jgi:hypothetical protein